MKRSKSSLYSLLNSNQDNTSFDDKSKTADNNKQSEKKPSSSTHNKEELPRSIFSNTLKCLDKNPLRSYFENSFSNKVIPISQLELNPEEAEEERKRRNREASLKSRLRRREREHNLILKNTELEALTNEKNTSITLLTNQILLIKREAAQFQSRIDNMVSLINLYKEDMLKIENEIVYKKNNNPYNIIDDNALIILETRKKHDTLLLNFNNLQSYQESLILKLNELEEKLMFDSP